MEISCSIQSKVRGIINIKLIRGGICHTDLTFENLILDTFFARFAANDTLFQGMTCRVGSGAKPPANGDTALVSQVATRRATTTTDNTAALDTPNSRLICSQVNQFEFPQGGVVANLAEIGFEFAPSVGGVAAGQLNSRSLIKDAFGTPTPLTVTADDQLVVNYTFELIVPLVDYISSIVLAGTTHSIVGRIAALSGAQMELILALPTQNIRMRSYASNTVLGDHGVNPTVESGAMVDSALQFLSVSGGKEFQFTATINRMNASGGIGAITTSINTSSSAFKYGFTPPIPKTNIRTLTLRFRMVCTRA